METQITEYLESKLKRLAKAEAKLEKRNARLDRLSTLIQGILIGNAILGLATETSTEGGIIASICFGCFLITLTAWSYTSSKLREAQSEKTQASSLLGELKTGRSTNVVIDNYPFWVEKTL